ncbi:MAG: response regulator transcription factor [Betaproteobacteria bacterium]
MNKAAAAPLICVVDDDDALRDSLHWLLESEGYRVAVYPTAERFLAQSIPGDSSCLLLDVRMPGLSGLELQQELNRRGESLPVIFITGHGDVPMAVNALKGGAFHFIEKPFNDSQLLELVERAVDASRSAPLQRSEHYAAAARLKTLSPREREVLDLIVNGRRNKQIADELKLSIKTVEAHRARVMEKMHVKTAAQLVQALLAGKSVG